MLALPFVKVNSLIVVFEITDSDVIALPRERYRLVGIGKSPTTFYEKPHEPDRLHYLLHYYRLTHVARAGPFSPLDDLAKARAGHVRPKDTAYE